MLSVGYLCLKGKITWKQIQKLRVQLNLALSGHPMTETPDQKSTSELSVKCGKPGCS